MHDCLVGAVDGGVEITGYRTDVKHKALMKNIQSDRGYCEESPLIAPTRKESQQFSVGTAHKAHTHRCDMNIRFGEGGIEAGDLSRRGVSDCSRFGWPHPTRGCR